MFLSRSSPAKVNLGLHVLRRRSDGYHDIETVFHPIGWSDRVDAEASGELSLTTTDPALPNDRGNLVWRAAEDLAAWAGITPTSRLHLDKRVPYGAGLGSGSSDAATALLILCDLWGLEVPPEDIHALAASLGADVPFFLLGQTSLGTGLGTDLSRLEDARGLWECPFWLTVIVPPVHVSTAAAYARVSPHDVNRPDLATVVMSNDLDRWTRHLTNDFEVPVVNTHPEVGRALDDLRDSGAGWAALSGSGSAVVGAFERKRDAQTSAARAEASGARTWVEPPGREGPTTTA